MSKCFGFYSTHQIPICIGTDRDNHLSRSTTKQTKWRAPGDNSDQFVHPPSLINLRCIESVAVLRVHSEDSDQTVGMCRLVWVFAGRKWHFVCFVVLRLIYLQVPYCFRSLKHLVHTLTGFLAMANWASFPEHSLQKMLPQFRQWCCNKELCHEKN